jgi:hypothetical protein
MKCSICDAENPPGATSCQKCGFSLSFSQPTWPDFPSVEIPEPSALPEWPDITGAEIKLPAELPIPTWPQLTEDVPTSAITEESDVEAERSPLPSTGGTIEELHVEEVDYPVPSTEGAFTADIPSPGYPSDDELARTHIARGFEAIREGLIDQARWEFEQARDLADGKDIVRLAQAQLSELLPRHEAAQIVQAPMHPMVKPPPRPALTGISLIDWKPTLRIGAVMGIMNAVCTSCTAVFCLGFLLSPFLGFVTGLLIARNKTNPPRQPKDIVHAIAAGGITGLGGWLGQAISYPIWTTSILNTLDAQNDSTTLACMTFLGMLYIPMTIALSALGWKLGKPREPSD